MEQIILVVHLLVALAIIGLILLQRGKGADIGASFGAGASQTLFGSSGSGNVLTRATGWLAAVFFASSFGLAVIADSRTAGDEDLGFEIPVEETAEIAPAEAPSSDLPMVESPADSDLPAMEAVGSEPEAEAAGAEDLPATEEQ